MCIIFRVRNEMLYSHAFLFILFGGFQAITLCPNVPVYWTNRALCHRKRKYVRPRTLYGFAYSFLIISPPSVFGYWKTGICDVRVHWPFISFDFLLPLFCSDWTKVEDDCRRAIQLDHSSFKVNIRNFLFSHVFHLYVKWAFLSKESKSI